MDFPLSTMDFTVKANSSSSNNDVGRTTKKVRTRPKLLLDKEDPTVDGNGRKV